MTRSEANNTLKPLKIVRPGTGCSAYEYCFLDALLVDRVLIAAHLEHVHDRRRETAREVVNRALVTRAIAAGRMPTDREPDHKMYEAEFQIFQKERDPVGEAEMALRFAEHNERLAIEAHEKKSELLSQTRDALAFHEREGARLKALVPTAEAAAAEAKDEAAKMTAAAKKARIVLDELRAGAEVIAKREEKEEADRIAAEAAAKEAAKKKAEADRLEGYRRMAEVAEHERAKQAAEDERLRALGRAALAGKAVRA